MEPSNSTRGKKAARIAWIAYAAVGSFLFIWDLSATGEHILGGLIVTAYSFPSSYLVYLLVSPLMAYGAPPVVSWLAMAVLNGWLVSRLVYFTWRLKREPIQPPVPTRGDGT